MRNTAALPNSSFPELAEKKTERENSKVDVVYLNEVTTEVIMVGQTVC